MWTDFSDIEGADAVGAPSSAILCLGLLNCVNPCVGSSDALRLLAAPPLNGRFLGVVDSTFSVTEVWEWLTFALLGVATFGRDQHALAWPC